jgi:L-amino acid N-acyltransferase YncA
MLTPDITRSDEDLRQILALQQRNLKKNLTDQQKQSGGFVTMEFSFDLMKNMHELAPSVIIRDGDKIIAYAIVLLTEGRNLYPDLECMFVSLDPLTWNGSPLTGYRYYVMGQICVDSAYRGNGLVAALYNEHRRIYKDQFDLLITEISTSNHRSMKAHERVGFRTIHTYRDHLDEWNVVVMEL